MQEETTQVLQRLVRFNTVNPPGNEREAQEYLAGYLQDAGLEVELLGRTEPRPNLVAWKETASPANALAKGLDRDRAVDETGHQVAVFGRIGSRPFNLEEQRRFFLDPDGKVWKVRE